MKLVAREPERLHLVLRDLDAERVLALIESGADLEAGRGGGVGDEVDDRFVAHKRAAPPVLGDPREHAVLNLVPLAGTGWVVGDADGEADLVGEALQTGLPGPAAGRVAAAGVGGDEQLGGVLVALVAHREPPAANRLDREGGGVVVDADAHPAVVGGEVVDTVGDGFAEIRVDEVVDPNGDGLALGLPFAAGVAEFADEFLLLGVNRDDRLALALHLGGLAGDVPELSVPIGVSGALERLLRALEAINPSRRASPRSSGDWRDDPARSIRRRAAAGSCKSRATATLDRHATRVRRGR